MAEFEDQLSSILSDQSAMSQIMSLAQSLSGGGSTPPEEPSEAPVWEEGEGQAQSPPPPPVGEGGDIFSMLGGVDPRLLQMGMRLMGEYQRQDDKNTALLAALRPFVKEKRYAKLDRAIQIARLSRVIRVLFDAMRENGGEEVV